MAWIQCVRPSLSIDQTIRMSSRRRAATYEQRVELRSVIDPLVR
jgi:hypothetical protein